MPLKNPKLENLIMSLSDGQKTAAQIAEIVGRSKSRVCEIIRKIGATPPKHEKRTGKPRNKQEMENLQKVLDCADGTLSSKEISEITGLNQKYIQNICKSFDLPRLPQGGPEGTRNGSYFEGRSIDRRGYATVKAPKGHPFAKYVHGKNIPRILEHRIVMETHVGRYLKPTEVVDHIDGISLHNDPLNLRLFPSNSDHLKNTISGQVPNWSIEGYRKMCILPSLRPSYARVNNYRKMLESGDLRLIQILRGTLLLGKDSPYLLGTTHWLERAGIEDFSDSSLKLHLLGISQKLGYSRERIESWLNP